MANLDFPRGFQPIRNKNGTPLTCESFDISASNGLIGRYDLLERRSDGYIHPAQVSSRNIVGVAAEDKAANSGGTILLYPIQGLVMRAQVNDSTVNAQTDIGLNYNIIAGTPSSTTGMSTMEIDGASQAVTATLPILIERVEETISDAGNELGANVVVECVVNECAYNGGGTGA